jgi:hypothetical protein
MLRPYLDPLLALVGDRSEAPALSSLLGDERPRHLLCVGTLPSSLKAALEARGCLIGSVPGIAGAFLALKRAGFDAVLVHPDEERLAIRFVMAIKHAKAFPGMSERFLSPLRERMARTPVWILPLQCDDEWALVLSATYLAIRRDAETSLAESICRLKPYRQDEVARA